MSDSEQVEVFAYTCERCLQSVYLTDQEAEQRRNRDGWLVIHCEECTKEPATPYESRRDQGCIVTWRTADGEVHVKHAFGGVLEALAHIIKHYIVDGSQVLSISTPRSIEGDLKGPRVFGGRRSHAELVDPYGVERRLLGKLHRVDLLHPPSGQRT